MNILRRFALVALGSLLIFSLLSLAWSHIALGTIRNRTTVKSWLDEGGFYDKSVLVVLENVQNNQAGDEGSQIPVNDPQIRAVVQNAFNPTFLKENVEKVLDGTYAWLQGETAKPVFAVDLTDAKAQLATGIGSFATTKASSLPACTPEQLTELTSDFDVFTATCLPPVLTPEQAGQQIQNEVLTNQDFLADTTFTGDDLTVEENGQKKTLNETDYKKVQDAYIASSYAPYLFGGLAVLSAIGIFFLSARRRQGVRRIGAAFLSSGIILALTWAAMDFGAKWIDRRAQELSGQTDAGRELASGIIKAVNQDVSSLLSWYAAAYLFIAVIAILASYFLLKPKKQPKPTIFNDAKTTPGNTPAPETQRSKPAPTPAQPKPTTAPELKKPKQPPKIQL